MIDHLGIQVADMAASTSFYDTVLAALSARRVLDFGEHGVGYGTAEPVFWVGPPDANRHPREVHVGFTAPDRAAVEAFHAAAVSTGTEILHAPRLWPEYHETYFAVFVRDPDGNNVEAVCHLPV